MEKTSVRLDQLTKCNCGAINIQMGRIEYSCGLDYFQEHFEIVDGTLRSKKIRSYYGCNHCINHWGLDLCACGSGEKPHECDSDCHECGGPSQSIEDARLCVKAGGSWT